MNYECNEITRLMLKWLRSNRFYLIRFNNVNTLDEFVTVIDHLLDGKRKLVSIDSIFNQYLNEFLALSFELAKSEIDYAYLYDKLLYKDEYFIIESRHLHAYYDWCLENHVEFDTSPSIEEWIENTWFYKDFLKNSRIYYK